MMPDRPLDAAERQTLLTIAREAIDASVNQKPLPVIDRAGMSEVMLAEGASFVTLTIQGALRGCIGALEAYQPLVDDVQEHAMAAALQDYRFPPMRPAEVSRVHIEISRLTPAIPLEYSDPADLLARLRPGIDGVILRDGRNRATFLPQVWEQVPEPARFLSQLCNKMGEPSDTWRRKPLRVSIYQVEEFHE